MKISVTVIALNEEHRIRACLESVRWADEIVIVDSGSVDRTRDLAREFTDKVFEDPDWAGYGRQKNRAASRARNDWILNVDADETVTEELAREIRALPAGAPKYPAYRVPRKNFIGDRWIRFGGWYPDRIVRLYDRRRAGFTETLVHEGVHTGGGGGTGSLEGPLLHRTYASLEDYFRRQERYARLAAADMVRAGRPARSRDRFLRPLFDFFKAYVLKLGFLEGYYGLALAWGHALYTYRKYENLRHAGGGGLPEI